MGLKGEALPLKKAQMKPSHGHGSPRGVLTTLKPTEHVDQPFRVIQPAFMRRCVSDFRGPLLFFCVGNKRQDEFEGRLYAVSMERIQAQPRSNEGSGLPDATFGALEEVNAIGELLCPRTRRSVRS